MKLDLVGLLDHLLPAAMLAQGEQTQLMKARILVFISLLYLVSLGFMVVSFTLLGLLGIFSLWSAVLSSTVSCCLYIWQLWYFKRSADLFRAANLGMFTMVTATTACIGLSGGWLSPITMILLCTPACAFLMEGKRTGLLWSAIVTAIGSGLLVLYRLGIVLPQLIDTSLLDYLTYFSWLYGFMIIASGMLLYGNINDTLNRAANLERRQLSDKATYDSLTGSYYRHAFQQRLPTWIDESRQQNRQLVFFEMMAEMADTTGREAMEKWLLRCVDTMHQLHGDGLVLSRSSGCCFQGLLRDIDNSDPARAQLQILHERLCALPESVNVHIAIGAVMVPGYSDQPSQILQAARAAVQDARMQDMPYLLRTEDDHPDKRRQRAASVAFVRCRYDELVGT